MRKHSFENSAYVVHVDPPSKLLFASVRFARKHIDPAGQWSIRLVLEINPTRMFAACGCDLDRLRNIDMRSLGAAPDPSRADIAAETLDDNDNFYTDGLIRRTLRADSAEVTQAAIETAWRLIERSFVPEGTGDAELLDDDAYLWERDDRSGELLVADQFVAPPLVFDFNWNRWSVRQMETYWEFDNEDALGIVEAVARRGGEVVEGMRVQDYDLDRPAREQNRNASSVVFPMGREGVRLVVYAKSLTRVRFEVRHDRNPRAIYSHRPEVHGLRTTSRENLLRLIEHVNREAASRLNVLLAEIERREVRVRPTITRLSVFLFHVAAACGHSPVVIQRVLSPLVHSGRIARHGPPEVLEAIERLEANGVLRRNRPGTRSRTDNLSLARQFADVVEHMRQGH